MSLKQIVEKNLGGTVDIKMIHLERAVNRIDSINLLENSINSKLSIVEAVDGNENDSKEHCRRCPFAELCFQCVNASKRNTNHLRLDGEVGCMLSFVKVLKSFLETENDYCVIFEDDCKFVGNLDELDRLFIRNKDVLKEADIILLGALKHIKIHDNINNDLSKIKVFDGTHAMIMTRNACNKSIEFYNKTTEQGYLYPADGFFSTLCNKYNLNMLGIKHHNAFFVQDNSFKSTIR